MSQSNSSTFIVNHSTKNGCYQIYQFDPSSEALFSLVKTVSSKAPFKGEGFRMAQIGGYLLQWSSIQAADTKKPHYHFKLIEFDPDAEDPLNVHLSLIHI